MTMLQIFPSVNGLVLGLHLLPAFYILGRANACMCCFWEPNIFSEPHSHCSCSRELQSAKRSGLLCSKYCGNTFGIHIQEVGWQCNKTRVLSNGTLEILYTWLGLSEKLHTLLKMHGQVTPPYV
jgi:hypothetical protein